MEDLLFGSWNHLGRTLAMGILAYAGLVFLLRISGRRTLSKMNAFDLVVTVALGSTLATVLLDNKISLARGVLAFALLIGLQYAVTWSSVRARWIRRVVTGEPALLHYRGKSLPAALKRTRVTEEEVRAAVRGAGLADMEEVEAVVLETDGSFSVVPGVGPSPRSSLEDIVRPGGQGD